VLELNSSSTLNSNPLVASSTTQSGSADFTILGAALFPSVVAGRQNLAAGSEGDIQASLAYINRDEPSLQHLPSALPALPCNDAGSWAQQPFGLAL
jgi:hypothetical protein